MSFLLGILIFVLALLFSIMLHEAGHFFTAKKFGMKVTQFFVGFGQTLWSRRKGETEYGVKAIPAGGFVKIVRGPHRGHCWRAGHWPERLRKGPPSRKGRGSK